MPQLEAAAAEQQLIGAEAELLNYSPALGLRHLDQFFGVWCCHEDVLCQRVAALDRYDLAAHVWRERALRDRMEANGEAQEHRGYQTVRGDIAVINLEGLMTKRGSSMTGGGTLQVRQAIRQAVNDPQINKIMLNIESPGGTVSGTKELADDIAAANKRKPTHAYIEDIGASAAYWVASQAGYISANKPANVGSIGTYAVLTDSSAAAEKAGLKVHVLRTGEFKGAGVPGAPITESQLADWQQLINAHNELFLDAVSRGRNMSQNSVANVATGQVWMADRAMALGLIDQVETFQQALDRLASVSTIQPNPMRDNNMSQQASAPAVPAAATISELRAACPDAPSDFLLQQMEAGATVAQAQASYIAAQSLRMAELRQQAEAAQASLEEARAAVIPGNPPITSIGEARELMGDARSEWKRLVNEKVSRGLGQDDAVCVVDRENPGLRERMLAEYKPTPNPR